MCPDSTGVYCRSLNADNSWVMSEWTSTLVSTGGGGNPVDSTAFAFILIGRRRFRFTQQQAMIKIIANDTMTPATTNGIQTFDNDFGCTFCKHLITTSQFVLHSQIAGLQWNEMGAHTGVSSQWSLLIDAIDASVADRRCYYCCCFYWWGWPSSSKFSFCRYDTIDDRKILFWLESR